LKEKVAQPMIAAKDTRVGLKRHEMSGYFSQSKVLLVLVVSEKADKIARCSFNCYWI
jgi:hypothetical protein